ncbi:MAG: nucleotidyltransferase family protein [Clostridia bacterium]|nr:nucleotidyltransferase family protein [Clostridia bacterium]
MNNTQATVLELIKASLFGISPDFPEEIDWESVFKEAKEQTVLALAFSAVPKEFAVSWEISAMQSQAHFMRALYEQSKLCNLFDDAAVPFVIIKGAAAAIYYPNPNMRTMGDIDVLVSENNFDAAFSLLVENGYMFNCDYGDGRDYSFSKDGLIFELHRRYSDYDYNIEDYIQNWIDKSEKLSLYGNTFPALPKAENGLIILDHIRHHLVGGLGIRQIIDYMMFVNSVKNEKEFEEVHLPLYQKTGLLTLAKVIIKMCKIYFGFPVSATWCDDADSKTCDELLECVLTSGNFGRKDPYEYRPVRSLTMDIKQNGVFKALQTAGLENSEFIKNHKLLHPFAWIYQTFRYIKRGIAALVKGERFKGDISSGKQKTDFYKRLGIK